MLSPKPPSPVRVGMKADEVLKLRGRSKAHAVAPAEWLEPGKSAVWHYADCSLVLEKEEPSGIWRVTQIVTGVPGEDEEDE